MSIKINGDLQAAAGDLLDVPPAQRQWPDVHANPGSAIVLPSTDPSVPAGCPWPLAGRFEATPYTLGSETRPRADIGQRFHDGQEGVTRYYVCWSYLPDATIDQVAQPGAQLIFADWHADLGTNPLRVTDGHTLEMKVMGGQRVAYAPGTKIPAGWSLYSGYLFQTQQVVPLADLAELRGRWFSWCCQWTWSSDATRGRFAFHLDGSTRLRWYGQTLSEFAGVTDERYPKLGVYELPGAVVWHTGWRSVTRWREALSLMTNPLAA